MHLTTRRAWDQKTAQIVFLSNTQPPKKQAGNWRAYLNRESGIWSGNYLKKCKIKTTSGNAVWVWFQPLVTSTIRPFIDVVPYHRLAIYVHRPQLFWNMIKYSFGISEVLQTGYTWPSLQHIGIVQEGCSNHTEALPIWKRKPWGLKVLAFQTMLMAIL